MLMRGHSQSVAHMPMKAMIYKTLSTVVDDLFACVQRTSFCPRILMGYHPSL